MSKTAKKSNPELWERTKEQVKSGTSGGRAGQWSARKAQLAVSAYKKKGGGYVGAKSADNHLQQWQKEDWGTKSGRTSQSTGERYLPRKARKSLSDREYKKTTEKKRADTRRGHQFSAQPKSIARKTAKYRGGQGAGETREALYEKAKRLNVPGRSRMSKAELQKAVGVKH